MSKSKVITVVVLWTVAIVGGGAAINGILRSENSASNPVADPSTMPSTQATPTTDMARQPLRDDLAFKAFQDLVREFDK